MLRKSLVLLFVFVLLFLAAVPVVMVSASQVQDAGVEEPTEDEGSILDRMLAGTLDGLIGALDAVTGTGLDEMVFLQGVEHRNYLPWHNPEQRALVLRWFHYITLAIAPFFIFPVTVTAFKLILKSGNPQDRAEAQSSIMRWFIAVLMIALAPLFMFTILEITTIMVDAIVWAYITATGEGLADGLGNLAVAETLVTGNIFTTAIVRLAFVFFTVYLSILYLLRLLSLSIHLMFTPFVAIMFAIKKDITAVSIWLGEIGSAAFMPVSHALVLCTILLLSQDIGWLATLVFLYSVIPLSEVLRNSLMDVLIQKAGWNEAATATKIMGAVSGAGMIAGVGKVAGAAFGGGAKPRDVNASKDNSNRSKQAEANASTTGQKEATGQDRGSSYGQENAGSFGLATTTVGKDQQSPGAPTKTALVDINAKDITLGSSSTSGGSGDQTGGSDSTTKKSRWEQLRPSEDTRRVAAVAGTVVGAAAGGVAKLIGGVVPGGKELGQTGAQLAGHAAAGTAAAVYKGGKVIKHFGGKRLDKKNPERVVQREKEVQTREEAATTMRRNEIQQQAEGKAAERAEKQEIYQGVQAKQPMSEKDYRSTLHTQAKTRVDDLKGQGYKLNDETMEKRAHDDIDKIIHQQKVNNESFPSANEVYQRERGGSNEFAGRKSPFIPQKEFEEHLKTQQRYDGWKPPDM